jgi:hypothetical protein
MATFLLVHMPLGVGNQSCPFRSYAAVSVRVVLWLFSQENYVADDFADAIGGERRD